MYFLTSIVGMARCFHKDADKYAVRIVFRFSLFCISLRYLLFSDAEQTLRFLRWHYTEMGRGAASFCAEGDRLVQLVFPPLVSLPPPRCDGNVRLSYFPALWN
jgi:hypothetical protein